MVMAVDELLAGIVSQQRLIGRELNVEISPVPVTPLYLKAFCRAVTNLLDNAFKYGDGTVTLAYRLEHGHLLIEVSDQGPGIPEESCEEVKRPFKRLDSARTGATGTGLGLAIVERVARQHGGSLRLLPGHPKGLIARMELPLRPESG